ncbi:MAG: hypothetical protein JNL83_18955 [Myxococcales bacterium]|nr:hypothetical protein [Myxococcales bacterium]
MRVLAVVVIAGLVACHGKPAVEAPGTGLRLGNVHRAIRTKVPAAQAAFDRGLAAMYGFNYDEARFQFAAAMRADASCAMCTWGFAMASGANINAPEKQAPGARDAADRFDELAVEPVEKALAEALDTRFLPKHVEMMPAPAAERERVNAVYAEAMRAVARQFPGDDDVQIAYVEALLIDTKRFVPLWDKAGQPTTPHALEARAATERVLARSPQSIGAIHYYIHVTDMGPYAKLCEPYAEKLGALAPDAGHLVHMPAHTFLYLGRYADAEDVNRAAIAADRRYLDRTPPGTEYEMFTMHPAEYLVYVLLWSGQHAASLKQVDEIVANHPPMPNPLGIGPGYIRALIAARYGRWDDALALPAPEGSLTTIGTHYAQGLALATKGKLDEAAAKVAPIRAAVPPPPPRPAAPAPEHGHGGDHATGAGANPPPMPELGPPPELLARVREIVAADAESAAAQLEAAIAFARGDKDTAIERALAAVKAEDALTGEGELMSFPLPARQRLGAYYLAAGRAADAERVFREDLAAHAENGWSLFGLATALEAQKRPDAAGAWKRFEVTWKRADTKLATPVF